MTWNDIDYNRKVVLIRPKEFSNSKTGTKELWKPKTGKPRAVPLSPLAKQTLENLPIQGPWVFSKLVTPSLGDDRLSAERLRHYLKKILKFLGLEGHLHTFRHSFISHALLQNIPEAIVRDWVGHLDPAILKIYTHIADHASQDAMQRLAMSDQTAESGKESNYVAKKHNAKQAQIKHTCRQPDCTSAKNA